MVKVLYKPKKAHRTNTRFGLMEFDEHGICEMEDEAAQVFAPLPDYKIIKAPVAKKDSAPSKVSKVPDAPKVPDVPKEPEVPEVPEAKEVEKAAGSVYGKPEFFDEKKEDEEKDEKSTPKNAFNKKKK